LRALNVFRKFFGGEMLLVVVFLLLLLLICVNMFLHIVFDAVTIVFIGLYIYTSWCICGNSSSWYILTHTFHHCTTFHSIEVNTKLYRKGVKNAPRVDIGRQTMMSMIAKIVPWECINKNKAASFAWIVCQVLLQTQGATIKDASHVQLDAIKANKGKKNVLAHRWMLLCWKE